jgi:hypothetical protein
MQSVTFGILFTSGHVAPHPRTREERRMEGRVHTVRSSAPLSVFVSSVMNDEMRSARDVCFEVLSQDRHAPYLFERTPASPDTAEHAFLDALKNADVIVWLVGSTTTDPVRLEVEAAREAGKHLLVYVFAAPVRDQATSDLLHTVRTGRTSAKTADVHDLNDLALQLRQSVDDLLTQALRRSGAPSREMALGELRSRLRDLAVLRWVTVGVGARKAFEMFADPALGSLPAEALPSAEHPLRVLVADVGAGKTLAAVRFLIEALDRASEDGEAPFPIWIDAARVDRLSEVIEAAGPFGDYRKHGLVLVLDGLDEKGSLGNGLFSEAMVLANGSPRSQVLVTARAGSSLKHAQDEQVALPDLTIEDATALMSDVFDIKVNAWSASSWTAPIRDALRRPLFALLMGRHIADHGGNVVSGPGALIDELVSEAFGQAQIDMVAANRTLMRLAARSISCDGKPVLRTEFEDRAALSDASRTRLIVEEASAVRFALPILRDWFGAQCLLHGVVPVEEVASSERSLERWRHALYVATSTLPRDSVTLIMSAVARRSPAFAAQIIDQGSAGRASDDSDVALPGAVELGMHVRAAIAAFADGLGPLTPIVMPWASDPMPPLGASLSRGMFGVLWPDHDVDQTTLPPVSEQEASEPAAGWQWSLRSAAQPEPIWPWRYSRAFLRARLGRRLGRLYVPGGAMERELAWATALQFSRRAAYSYTETFTQPIPADRLRTEPAGMGLADIPDGVAWVDFNFGRGHVFPLQPLRDALARGDPEPACPYPDRDEPRQHDRMWAGFSPERMRQRTVAVYSAALAIYVELVDAYFVGMKARLNTAQILPARLVGILTMPSPDRQPGLRYYLEPLPLSGTTEVVVSLDGPTPDWEKIGNLQEYARARRPEAGAPPTLSLTTEGLDIFGVTPALSKAWEWLAEDLSVAGWLEGRVSIPW